MCTSAAKAAGLQVDPLPVGNMHEECQRKRTQSSTAALTSTNGFGVIFCESKTVRPSSS